MRASRVTNRSAHPIIFGSVSNRRVYMKFYVKNLASVALCFGLSSVASAQNPPATPAPADQTAAAPAPAAPAPLSSPSITGPISNLPPAVFDAGPFGKIDVNG